MDYNTIFVGMDVHKEKFSLCCYSITRDEFSHPHTTAADYKHVLAYLASLRKVFGPTAPCSRDKLSGAGGSASLSNTGTMIS